MKSEASPEAAGMECKHTLKSSISGVTSLLRPWRENALAAAWNATKLSVA